MSQGSATMTSLAPEAEDGPVYGEDGDLLATGKFGRCLHRLLDALGWRGENRHLLEALPHLEQIDDLETLHANLLHPAGEQAARGGRHDQRRVVVVVDHRDLVVIGLHDIEVTFDIGRVLFNQEVLQTVTEKRRQDIE